MFVLLLILINVIHCKTIKYNILYWCINFVLFYVFIYIIILLMYTSINQVSILTLAVR